MVCVYEGLGNPTPISKESAAYLHPNPLSMRSTTGAAGFEALALLFGMRTACCGCANPCCHALAAVIKASSTTGPPSPKNSEQTAQYNQSCQRISIGIAIAIQPSFIVSWVYTRIVAVAQLDAGFSGDPSTATGLRHLSGLKLLPIPAGPRHPSLRISFWHKYQLPLPGLNC